MYVLGIETSCDETSAAVVRDGREILSNITASSLRFHKKYGGVIPEIAFRMQLETITSVADSCLKEAGLQLKDIGLASVTDGPGLLGSLVTGIAFAKSIASSLDIPLLGINHLYSHMYAGFLNGHTPTLPFVALVVSGGHTSLFYAADFDRIRVLGQTLDDACGEAFDKVAKILGLGYPGGPLIEKIAKAGDPLSISFRCSGTKEPLDFSFSGIKTAVLYYVQRRALCSRTRELANSRTIKSDIAASFQETVIDTLIEKSLLACRLKKTKHLVLGGGVVANSRLREKFSRAASGNGINLFFPPKALCTDNAAMVAGLGYRLFKKGHRSDLNLDVKLN
jgi:N6-L-threonylcarbamoyladenine synthase